MSDMVRRCPWRVTDFSAELQRLFPANICHRKFRRLVTRMRSVLGANGMHRAKWCFVFVVQSFAISVLASDFALPPGVGLEVTRLTGDGAPRTWQFASGSAQYARLQAWLLQNQCGWSSYLATTPGRGLLVDAGDLRLQVLKSKILYCPRTHGCRQHNINGSEFEFLEHH
jgi:hypothetical protein